ncbi:MAG TPA: RHS repeat-associated core domain-containing protein, partial [Chitinophagaceae bacterium]|nr:RHS repeat-associated core domain-containing protein [Chitinophagaceae bacterium]
LARKNNTILKPVHVLQTNYRYNTLNQVVAQNSPDAGLSTFWYDRLGRLVISQNAKQRTGAVENNRYYSYTGYDYLGRINEVGQIRNPSIGAIGMTDIISRSQTSLNSWITNNYTRIDNVTRTYYDIPNSLIQPQLYAVNLRNRVAYTSLTIGNNATPSGYAQATYYSYDIHGNVDTLLQDYGNSTVLGNVMNANGNRWKKMVYNYDIISGKVNDAQYQPGQKDQFYHRYEYDADNRLTNVYTSYDKIIWEQDVRYEYYKHGPLARSLIGEQLVQGMDYAYTLQGWLKGVNSTSLNPDFDMGDDGKTNGQRRFIARDAYGFNLNYFMGDYAAINGNTPFPNSNGNLGAAYKPLYNGNISSMVVNVGKITSLGTNAEKLPKLYNYSYDQLNRLTGMDAYNRLNETNNSWSPLTPLPDYKERIAYDANGNILRYLRQGFGANLAMDSLTYNYTYSGGKLSNNKLNYVRDRINNSTAHSSNYTEDIDDQASANYTYDLIGNLTKDNAESITSIVWNVYGKITQIVRTATANNPVTNVQYTYDAAGNRISKRIAKAGTTTIEYSWYVRDAQGNVMATYNSTGTGSFASYPVNLTEQHLYGSGRLGIVNRTGINMKTTFAPGNYRSYIRGDKFYELSNHLGNVLTVISDKKIGTAQSGNPTLIDYYTADIINASDYAPFGMQMVGRKFEVVKFRYGFNGKENDNEMKGEGNQQDYGMRIYDPRLGRFLSVDPLTKTYPWYTPYQFAGNGPILNIDLDGAEPQNSNQKKDVEVKKLHPHIEDMPSPSSNMLPAKNTGVLEGMPEQNATSSMTVGRHNDDNKSAFNSTFTIMQVDVITTGTYKEINGKTYWQESKSVISTEMTVTTNFNQVLSTSQMTQTSTTLFTIEKAPITLSNVKGEVVSASADIVFLNAHGKAGPGIGEVEPNENMSNLMEMGRQYVLKNDGKIPTAHIKESNKKFFKGFFSKYSDVLQKVNPIAGKTFRKIAEVAVEHDFGKTVLGQAGVFASKITANGVVLRDQRLPNINK